MAHKTHTRVHPCSPGTGADCKITEHEHDVPGGCGHCGQPIHYDNWIEDYVHDDPSKSCFLVPARREVVK